MHFYVYFYKDGKYLFDRTCGTQDSAEERVKHLRQTYRHATYTIDHLIKGAFH